ncbi:MAG: hypothetical protein ACRDNA_02075 [Gaiellaceae bacterium]
MLQALATGCPDYQTCWRPVETPDGLPFASVELAVAWAVVLALSLAMLLRRLGQE